jgi:hypothetical protein
MTLYRGDDSMTTTNADGRARRSLAEQLDRLDSILDGLAEALQGAVTTAVTEAVGVAVKEAVQGVLAEVLTNPALQQKLRGMAGPPPPPAEPTPAATPGSRLRDRLSGLGGRARSLGGWAGGCLAALWRRAKAAPWLVAGSLALGAGVLAGLVAHLAGWPVAVPAGTAGAVLARVRSLARQPLAVPATGR